MAKPGLRAAFADGERQRIPMPFRLQSVLDNKAFVVKRTISEDLSVEPEAEKKKLISLARRQNIEDSQAKYEGLGLIARLDQSVSTARPGPTSRRDPLLHMRRIQTKDQNRSKNGAVKDNKFSPRYTSLRSGEAQDDIPISNDPITPEASLGLREGLPEAESGNRASFIKHSPDYIRLRTGRPPEFIRSNTFMHRHHNHRHFRCSDDCCGVARTDYNNLVERNHGLLVDNKELSKERDTLRKDLNQAINANQAWSIEAERLRIINEHQSLRNKNLQDRINRLMRSTSSDKNYIRRFERKTKVLRRKAKKI